VREDRRVTVTPLAYREVLRLPHVSGLLLSACLSRLAGRMFALVVVLYVLDHFGSAALAGWTAFASLAPGFLISPVAGALLDRAGVPVAIAVDMAASAALLAGLVAANATGVVSAPVLLVLTALYSLTSPLSAAGIRALLPRMVPERALDRVNALDTGSYSLVEVLGPVLAGPLFAFAGVDAAMLAIAGLYAAGAVSLVPLIGGRLGRSGGRRDGDAAGRAPGPGERPRRFGAAHELLRESFEGLAYLLRHSTLRGLAVSYSCYQAAWGILVVAVPVFVAERLGEGTAAESLTGLLWATAGLAGAVGALVAGHLRAFGRERGFILLGTLATAVAVFPVGPLFGLAGLAAGLVLIGLWEGPVNVGLLTLRQRRTEPDRLGRVLAVSISLNLAGLPVGSAIGGMLVTQSTTMAFAVAAVACLLSTLGTLVLIPARTQ
jgi:MFS family permease